MNRRLFSTLRVLQHENPLGLPKSGTPPRMQRGLPEKRHIPNVKKIIAVSSAKGGVGKSTIAANLALSFARLGHRTGILDTDLFGPSIPTLFNLTDAEEPRLNSNNQLLPLTNYGVATMSMGYLVPASSAVVWRGLMLSKALQQLLHDVAWPPLDVLVLDLPPGTGDVPLSIAQQLHLAGALVVSTPQQLALADALRGLRMWEQVDVRVLGVLQNMAGFVCPCCGERTRVFGRDEERVRKACEERGVLLLGDIPLDPKICEEADGGRPTVVAEPDGERAKAFLDVASRVREMVDVEG